ncbi:MFS transporter [Actinomadura sp. NEAU-AAG7]|uniref:MFS transporter n=1 Tax=Actinomadura sp. NEAU-AAG7 TaxID=2839640 RepID=UPI001BE4C736|nr:MFS transporter [Actinomadura sp. NEAU-AAG7]MBT2210884.1 MFS transporter [Actinomadura sp. NEAU-AAG7]
MGVAMTHTQELPTRTAPPPPAAPGALWAARAPFLATGLVLAGFFVRVPSLKMAFGLSDGRLGLLLTLPVLSGLAAMQLTGRLVARFGSAPIVRLTMAGLPVSLLCVATSGGQTRLALALLLFGALDGLVDVSMNAHAITVERTLDRRVMNSCHASWSIGAAAGSILGGLAIKAGLSLTEHFLIVALVLVAFTAATGPYMLSSRTDRVAEPARRTGWTPRILMFGAVGTIVLVCSGVMGNWSGVFLHDELGMSLAAASLGYIFFSTFETGGRLVGDRLQTRFGAPLLVRCGGALAITGLATVVVSPLPVLAVAGFAIFGLGLSVLLPIIFSTVGHNAADSEGAASALAKVSTLTYTGLLIGPMAVGLIAEKTSLTTTLAGLLALLTTTLALSLRLFPRT